MAIFLKLAQIAKDGSSKNGIRFLLRCIVSSLTVSINFFKRLLFILMKSDSLIWKITLHIEFQAMQAKMNFA